MGTAVYNQYGSLFSEKVYQAVLADECRARGLRPVQREVRILLTHADFKKEYFIDLLVASGAVFELKAADAITDEHRAQTLNYLFLVGLSRAKLLNFGPDGVQDAFVSTQLTPALRRRLVVGRQRWKPFDRDSERFCELMLELLGDWGAFLQLPLYYDAVAHVFGGRDAVIREIPVIRENIEIAVQKTCLLNPQTAFKLTAVSSPLDAMEQHVRRWLRHTKLRAVQWVNLHHHDITFTTLLNDC